MPALHPVCWRTAGLATLGALLAAATLFRPAVGAPAGPEPADPFQEPLLLAARAQAAYARMRDYTCVFIKRERLAGVLSPNHVVHLRARTVPFSIHLQWQEPRELAGQEVCYVAGRNHDRLRVRPSGLLGSVGFLSLAQDDPRVRRHSRHRISQAGIGHVIDRCCHGWPAEQQWRQTEVRVASYEYAGKQCRRVEMIHPTPAGGRFEHYCNVLYFDQETALPIRVENYDWPRRPGEAGELAELFCYVHLRVNVGLGDDSFRK